MLRFTTKSGQNFTYNPQDNMISRCNEKSYLSETCRVTFRGDEKLSLHKIPKFTIEITQQCNLRCTYCCYSGQYEGRREHAEKDISWDTLNKTIDFILKYYDRNDTLVISFYGGEALLVKEKMKWVIDTLLTKINTPIQFSLATNGLSLTEDTIRWLCAMPDININVSLDGSQEIHDSCRKTLNGKGSYDIIMQNLRYFKEHFPKEYAERVNFLATVSSWSKEQEISDFWSKNDFLSDKQPVVISHIIPNFEKEKKLNENWDEKIAFFDKALEHYKKGKKDMMTYELHRILRRIEDRQFFPLPEELAIKTCLSDMYEYFITVDGDIYPCEKFCTGFQIGTVFDDIDEKNAHTLLHRFVERKNKFCQDCWAVRLCGMCLTNLNFKDDDMPAMCKRERENCLLALKYYCEVKEFENFKQKLKQL